MAEQAPTAVTAASGRSAGFADILDIELDRAYRVAGHLLGDACDAEDAVQDALTQAWAARRSLRNPEAASAWFWRILVNNCRSRLRRRRRPQVRDLGDDVEVAGDDPFEMSLARDEVLRAMANLSADHRIAIVLRFWGDFTVPEIARRTGAREGTVKSRLHAAIGALRRDMDANGEARR